jgi:hypothetical protein
MVVHPSSSPARRQHLSLRAHSRSALPAEGRARRAATILRRRLDFAAASRDKARRDQRRTLGAGREGRTSHMEELIGRITAVAGIDAGLAQKAVGIILGFLKKEGPPAEVGQLRPGRD